MINGMMIMPIPIMMHTGGGGTVSQTGAIGMLVTLGPVFLAVIPLLIAALTDSNRWDTIAFKTFMIGACWAVLCLFASLIYLALGGAQ